MDEVDKVTTEDSVEIKKNLHRQLYHQKIK